MSTIRTLIAAGLFAAAAALTAAPASAEEITASHLAAARQAMTLIKADRSFDDLLPVLSQQVQNQLINVRPDLYAQIGDAVNAVALQLAARRSDLDNDVARIWAKAFSEEELNALVAFYSSSAGKKFLELGPKSFNDSMQTAKSWSDRVRDELLEKSREELKKRNIDF